MTPPNQQAEAKAGEIAIDMLVYAGLDNDHTAQELFTERIQSHLTPLFEELERLMLRSVLAMAIAENDEGWQTALAKENPPCPMLLAVAKAREELERLKKENVELKQYNQVLKDGLESIKRMASIP